MGKKSSNLLSDVESALTDSHEPASDIQRRVETYALETVRAALRDLHDEGRATRRTEPYRGTTRHLYRRPQANLGRMQ